MLHDNGILTIALASLIFVIALSVLIFSIALARLLGQLRRSLLELQYLISGAKEVVAEIHSNVKKIGEILTAVETTGSTVRGAVDSVLNVFRHPLSSLLGSVVGAFGGKGKKRGGER